MEERDKFMELIKQQMLTGKRALFHSILTQDQGAEKSL
jgi:hypothetical protein